MARRRWMGAHAFAKKRWWRGGPSRNGNHFVGSRYGGTAEDPGEKNPHVRNDDGGAAPTRNGTNWVVQGWEAAALGDVDTNDYLSMNACGNESSSSSAAELLVGAREVNWETGSHRLGKVQRRGDPAAVAGGLVERNDSSHLTAIRGHCAIVKKG
jgi:hypothetical protein